jgi:acetolactate synthase-1/2/3 large subunit
MSDTVASILLKILKKHNIRHIYGLPAAQISLIMDGAGKDPFFKYMTTRHEEACGHMAHAIGKITDSMAVCFATVGPGATNMVPGVAAAWADNIPMLVLTPNNQARSIYPAKDMLQNADQIGLYKPITKWSAVINHPERAAELIERAIHIARTGRPGPVHLDIPCDIHTCEVTHDITAIPSIPRARPVPSPAEIEQLANLLATARRPFFIAGGGVVRSDGVEEFRALMDQTGIPASTTAHARGTVSPKSPLYIGSGGVFAGSAFNKAAQEADVIVAIGCKFASMTPVNKPPLAPLVADQVIVQIDIEGEVLGRNVPINLGLVGDARETVKALAAALKGRKMNVDSAWVQSLLTERKEWLAKVNAVADNRTSPGTNLLNEAAMMRQVAELLPKNAIVATDGGQIMEWANTFYEPESPRDFMFVPGMGHLGFGLPMAIAAKQAYPDRPVVCITGDGAMGMTGQELETAVRYDTPVVVIVANDSHWGMYRPLGEHVFQNKNFGTKLTDVDFVKVAQGYGADGVKVDTLEGLAKAIPQALASKKPFVIDVVCDFTPHPVDSFWPDVILADAKLAPVDI